jgi:hypothetical protein
MLHQEENIVTDIKSYHLNFNDAQTKGPIICTLDKLIDDKNAVQLAISILKEEEEEEMKNIFSVCEITFDECKICNAEKISKQSIKF